MVYIPPVREHILVGCSFVLHVHYVPWIQFFAHTQSSSFIINAIAFSTSHLCNQLNKRFEYNTLTDDLCL